jgi:tetratricopeptide (TPR) repeat protein
MGWAEAAQFCADKKINLEEGLTWADNAISLPFIGKENFTTLQAKSRVLLAMGREQESQDLMMKAVSHPSASVPEIHQYGRSLINAGKNQEAMQVFTLNRKNHPEDMFTTYVGMARGYAALGDKKNAIKNWETAIKNLPEDQKSNLAFYQSELDKLKQ